MTRQCSEQQHDHTYQESGDGAHEKVGSLFEKRANALLLRNAVTAVAAMLFHECQGMLFIVGKRLNE